MLKCLWGVFFSWLEIGTVLFLCPGAVEDFDGGSGHVDAVVVAGPVEFEVASGEVCSDLPVASVCEGGGDGGGAGAGTAGQGDAAASFPGSHCEFGGVIYLDEMDVDSVWEDAGLFDYGS